MNIQSTRRVKKRGGGQISVKTAQWRGQYDLDLKIHVHFLHTLVNGFWCCIGLENGQDIKSWIKNESLDFKIKHKVEK